FKDLGATTLSIRNTTWTDHLSFDAAGLAGFQFVQDPLEYSTRSHHTNMDVYDRLQKSDLMQASAIMAAFVYNAAMREEMLPRKPLPKPQRKTGLRSDIEFSKPGGVGLTLDAYVPEGDGPFPAAVLVHGGGFTRGAKETLVKPLFDPLSDADFAWFSINYRLAPQHKYPAAVEDVERAIEWVRAHAAEYNVDPNRIALIGESAGGHLVSMVGARNKPASRVRAVVSVYGLHDVERREVDQKSVSESIEAFLGVKDLSPKSIQILRDASPSNYISSAMPPYLLVHGTKDDRVPYEQSPKMCEKMRAAGASCDLITIDGGGHGMGGWDKARRSYKPQIIEWLKETLGQGM
ncbi:MAG: alpha/beta hydrolase fold domain-containing protein, partial [Bryobacteraceae bacterium]